MLLFLPQLIMGGLGLAKGAFDKKREQKERRAAAEMNRWSPWTGVSAGRVKAAPGFLESALQGVGAGFAMQGELDKSRKPDIKAVSKDLALAGIEDIQGGGRLTPWARMRATGER